MLSFVVFKVSRCDFHYPWCLTLCSLQAKISNNIHSNVYLKVKQVCLKAIYRGGDVQCCHLTHWNKGKSIISSTVDVE